MSQKEKSDNYWFRIKKQILEFLFAVMNRTKFKKILFLKLVQLIVKVSIYFYEFELYSFTNYLIEIFFNNQICLNNE